MSPWTPLPPRLVVAQEPLAAERGATQIDASGFWAFMTLPGSNTPPSHSKSNEQISAHRPMIIGASRFLFPRKPTLCPPVLVGVHSLPPVLPCGQKKPKTLVWSFSAPAMGISPETPRESAVLPHFCPF